MNWQPIDTAPKSSQHILGFGDGSAIERCCYVMSWGEAWPSGKEGWLLMCSIGHLLSPTHWMPLPEPPK